MLLKNREELKERTAESMTLPDFIALTTFEANNGKFCPLEVRIEEVSDSVDINLQSDIDENIHYVLKNQGIEYSGSMRLALDSDLVTSQLHLDKINGRRVIGQQKKKKTLYVYKDETSQFRELTSKEIKMINYWVPTAINRVANNVNYFLSAIQNGEGGAELSREKYSSGNHAHLIVDEEESVGSSKSDHFRSMSLFLKKDGEIGFKSGTFVKTDWSIMDTSLVSKLLQENAKDILPRHFNMTLLPQITQAGHSAEHLTNVYNTYH